MYMPPALVTSLASESKSTIALTVIIAAVVATLGYRLSQRNRMTRGVTPWRIPSIVWAIICFFFAPFGIALELIAIMSTRPATGKLPTPKVADAGLVTSYAPPASTLPAAEAVPAYRPRTPPSGFAAPHSDVLGKPALFGWYPDVAGRHELRYWDGRDWTGHVSDDGTVGEDPLAPPPSPSTADPSSD